MAGIRVGMGVSGVGDYKPVSPPSSSGLTCQLAVALVLVGDPPTATVPMSIAGHGDWWAAYTAPSNGLLTLQRSDYPLLFTGYIGGDCDTLPGGITGPDDWEQPWPIPVYTSDVVRIDVGNDSGDLAAGTLIATFTPLASIPTPVASFTATPNGNGADLDGTASTGTGLTYEWQCDYASISDVSSAVTRADTSGTVSDCVMRLIVTDAWNRTDTDTMTFDVLDGVPGNFHRAPTAAVSGSTTNVYYAVFDGHGSTGKGLTYQWSLEAGAFFGSSTDQSCTVVFVDTENSTPNVANGTYATTLTVTDADGNVSRAAMTCDVLNGQPGNYTTTTPADIAPDARVFIPPLVSGSIATVNGTGSTGGNLTFAWTDPFSIGVVFGDPTAATTTIDYAAVTDGGKDVLLTVTNGAGSSQNYLYANVASGVPSGFLQDD